MLLLQCIGYLTVFAANDPIQTSPLLGSKDSVKVNYVSTVTDFQNLLRIDDPSLLPLIEPNTTHITNIVSVGIEEENKTFIKTDFTVSIVLHIKKYNPALTLLEEFDSTFTINYKKAEGAKYNASQYLSFENAYKVEVKIVSITPDTTSWDVSKVLRVDNILEVSRDYVFDCTKVIPGLNVNLDNVNGELTAAWNDPGNGQTEYDLEWAWIDESAVTDYQQNGQFSEDKLFTNNATRVTISGLQYNIPLLYDGDGRLFVRVRPAQVKVNGQRVEGTWTWLNDQSGNPVFYTYSGHQNNLNWQASTSYAEEGKRKTVVQYFDGTLRNRQTVTKDNTTGTTVVAESYYDYQGRPVIQVLPAPTLNTIIQYSENFNKAVNYSGYPKWAYDKLDNGATACDNPAAPLSTTAGASKYYSPNNALNSTGTDYNPNKYIPNSEGPVSGEAYPFTETRFNGDGRVGSQGGVGYTYQLGSGHETKYYYESPAQEELDALFGTDAGIASHYFKNMVRDANGQYSVSYTDMHGRTVATALAGDVPKNADGNNLVEPLSSLNTQTFTKQLIDDETNRINGTSIVSSKPLIVPKSGSYQFDYELNPDQLKMVTCNEQDICYDCLYNLKITINADCNGADGFPYTVVDSNFTIGGLLTSPVCNENGKATGHFSKQFSVTLPEGAYTVTKTLSLSDSAQNIYRDVFLKNDSCKKLQDFYNEAYQVLQTKSNCVITCSACDSAIGHDLAGFRQNFIAQTGVQLPLSDSMEASISAAYNEARTNCDRICNNIDDDGMENIRSIRKIMLLDVSPAGGQYANPDSTSAMYSIFNSANANLVFTQQYKNELGQIDTPVFKGNPSAQLFSDQFKSSWAEQLLPLHPEYCRLQTIEQQLPATYHFEADLNNLNTWNDMVAATTPGGDYITNLVGHDPFFSNISGSAPGFAYHDSIIQALSQYSSTGQGGYLTLWQIAQSIVLCRNYDTTGGIGSAQSQCVLNTPSAPPVNLSACEQDRNLVWTTFRNIYLSIRAKYISKYLNSQCTAVTNASLFAQGKTPRFFDSDDNTSMSGADAGNLNDFFNQINNGDNAATQTGAALLKDQYDSTCIGYATTWIQQLSECDILSTRWQDQSVKTQDSTWIVDRLRDVCVNGSDQDHYLGSSSINPDSLSTTQYGYSDFPSVIQSFFQTHGLTLAVNSACNPYLITVPKPYGKQAPLTNTVIITKPSDCECTQITALSAEYQGSGYTGNFSSYLESRYQTVISQGALDTLLHLCDGTYQCVFLPAPITLPAVLQCQKKGNNPDALSNACINCAQFQAIKDSFELLYNHQAIIEEPQSDSDLNWNLAFQSFANYKTGFSKTWNDYLAFEDTCSGTGNFSNNTGSLTFIKTYSSSSDSASRTDVFYDMKRNSDGSFISVGITKKNSENNDGLVVKKDKYGNVLWAKKFGGSGEDDLNRITLTSDGGCIVIGNTNSYRSVTEIWVIKLSANGNEQWSKRYNAGTTHGEIGRGIIQTSDGGYALISEYDFAPTSADWTVLKLDNTGNVTWAKRFGSNNSDNAGSLIQDGDSLLVSALAYSTALYPTIPFSYYNGVVMKIGINDGSVGWVKTYDIDIKSNWFYDLYKTDSGYILNSIIADDWYANNPHSTMVRINKNGDVKKVIKVNSYSTSSSGYLSIFPTTDNGFISVQDDNSTTSDVYLQKTDSAGNPVWANRISIPGIQRVARIFENPDGSFTAAGFSDTSALVIKTDSLGQTGCNDSSVTITNSLPSYTAVSPTLAYNSTISISENSVADSGSILPLKTTTFCSSSADNGPHLCGNNEPVFQTLEYKQTPCKDLDKIAYNAAQDKWQLYIDSVRNVFDTAYYNKCMSAKNLESFKVTYQTSEYHYTLYYYDQAGNLVETVPPAGVDDKHGNTAFLDSVKMYRANELLNGPSAGNSVVPHHTLVTRYRYNALNQVIAQQSPDAGVSKFWYDALGRLVVSQNAQQALDNKYSYTEYDILGRIAQVGQKPQTTAMTQVISRNPATLNNWLTASQNKEQITRSVYDISYYAGEQPGTLEPTLYQKNLRNRVSYNQVFDLEPAGTDPGKWAGMHSAATYYSYDIHGNVDTLLQDYNTGAMAQAGNRFKKIVYDYDLISGKVNMVSYQPNQPDAFYHKYGYDAENRLTDVETSRDKLVWEHDARYYYYKHGPLARTILGQQQVQGLDYAYTLQGWLKGVNSTAVGDGTFDMGQDGKIGSANAVVARDAYGFALSYNNADYNAIYPLANSSLNPFAAASAAGTGFNGLYNGNIAGMAVNIPKAGQPLLYTYTYDQLNRLTKMFTYNGLNPTTNSWNVSAIDDYREQISYDANGNIVTYKRNGSGSSLNLNNYSYSYTAGTNRLQSIYNGVNSQTQTYAYDAIGNTTADGMQGITNAVWNVYGKLQSLTNKDGQNVTYTYDATGQRISKKVGNVEECYVKDASGSTMAIYTKDAAINGGHLSTSEFYKYGSSLLGTKKTLLDMQVLPASGSIITFKAGETEYLLTDQRGNNMAAISDKKLQHSTDGVIVDYYTADVRTASLYSSYGAITQSYHASDIKIAFNGQRRSTEISTTAQTAQFWEYNGDVGRRWNIDRVYKNSPYEVFGGNPILYGDPFGLDTVKNWNDAKVGDIWGNSNGGSTFYYKYNGKDWESNGVVKDKPMEAIVITASESPSQVRKRFALAFTAMVANKEFVSGMTNLLEGTGVTLSFGELSSFRFLGPAAGIASLITLSGDNVTPGQRMEYIEQKINSSLQDGDPLTAREYINDWNKDSRNKYNRIVLRYMSFGEFRARISPDDGLSVASPFDRNGNLSVKYITPDVYLSVKSSKSFLALPTAPDIAIWTFENDILATKSPSGSGVYSKVKPKYGELGGGREAIIVQPFPIRGFYPLIK